jgi:hypothetical protein
VIRSVGRCRLSRLCSAGSVRWTARLLGCVCRRELYWMLKRRISSLTEGIWRSCRRITLGTYQVKVKVTLRLTVSQSVRLGVEPTLGLLTRWCFPVECGARVIMRRTLDWKRSRISIFVNSDCWLKKKSVSKQQPDRQDFHGNQQSQQFMYCCERCLHLGPPQGS